MEKSESKESLLEVIESLPIDDQAKEFLIKVEIELETKHLQNNLY